jgi:hypothetical protein
VTIITNHHPRDIIDAWELSPAERTQFEYLDWEAIGRGDDSASFFRYRGDLFDLGEFSSFWGLNRDGGLPAEFAGWDGYISDTYFSGIVVRYVAPEYDAVVVARFAYLD